MSALESIDGAQHLSRSTLEAFIRLATERYPEKTERLLRRLRYLDAVRTPCRCCAYRNQHQQQEACVGLRGVCRQCHKALQREIKTGRATESELVACGLLEERT